MSREISFAPDRRSVQNNFIHFAYRPSKREFTSQDAVWNTLNKEYQDRFDITDQTIRNDLIQILLQISITHHSLSFIAAANLGIYRLRNQGLEFNPDNFKQIADWLLPKLIGNVQGKKPEEINLIVAANKATLFRYMEFIQQQIPEFKVQPIIEIVEEAPELTDFPVIQNLLATQQIVNFQPRPDLQSYTIDPNQIFSFTDRSGREYLVAVKYVRETNQIFPPETTPPPIVSEAPSLTDFSVIQNLLSQGEIVNFKLRPDLQEYATSPNQILSFTDKQNQEYLALVRYQSETNQIYPPQSSE